MVWGAIFINGASRLFIVEGTMNAVKYIETLNSHLKPRDKLYIFQQDSAPCHTARKVHDWMNNNYIKLLPWPSNLPDMNPIESLWDILKHEILEVSVSNKILFVERLIHVWFHFKIQSLC